MMKPTRRIASRLAAPALVLALLFACSDEDPPTGPGGGGGGGPDAIAPGQIVDAAIEYAGECALLTWTAPGDNDRVESYDIRYSYSFPLLWELALRVDDPPQPGAPGDPQSYAIENPLRGRDLYAAIRSVDPSGNIAPVSGIAHARIQGYTIDIACIQATTGEPVAGLDVTITARHVHDHVTDAEGRAIQTDLTGGAVNVAVRPGTSGVPYHHINDPFDLAADEQLVYKLIPYQPTALGVFETTLQLFKAAAAITPQRPVFKKWHSLPVSIYVPAYVNANGLDYYDITRTAADRWEERTGIDLWEFVPEPPDTGVTFFFKTRQEMGIQVGYTVHIDGPDGYPVANEVSVVNDYVGVPQLYKTVLHELGHTIRLFHLPAGYLMYGGQPLPDDITDDEVLAVQLHAAIPNGIRMSIYDDSAPDTTP